jgi:hypothetical protein
MYFPDRTSSSSTHAYFLRTRWVCLLFTRLYLFYLVPALFSYRICTAEIIITGETWDRELQDGWTRLWHVAAVHRNQPESVVLDAEKEKYGLRVAPVPQAPGRPAGNQYRRWQYVRQLSVPCKNYFFCPKFTSMQSICFITQLIHLITRKVHNDAYQKYKWMSNICSCLRKNKTVISAPIKLPSVNTCTADV